MTTDDRSATKATSRGVPRRPRRLGEIGRPVGTGGRAASGPGRSPIWIVRRSAPG